MKLFIFYLFSSNSYFYDKYFLSRVREAKEADIYIYSSGNTHSLNLMVAGFIRLKTYKDLSSPENFRSDLHRVGGVYGLINTADSNNIKQYIGSSKYLYQRLLDHLKGRDSNSRLQRSINKHGLSNF